MAAKSTLNYQGCNYFRQRIIIATLNNRPVKINKIRDKDVDPGVKDFEINLLKLVEEMSNGCKIDINESGTRVFYQPGLLHGGKIEHQCSNDRSIGYYLEALIAFAPFCKKPIDATLYGITNDQRDPSVDWIKVTTLPVLKRFIGVDEGLELKIISRGLPPNGGGEVKFSCPIRRQLRPIQFTNPGKIKRIRGVAYAVRVSPAMANRMVEAAKGILLKFLPDIYIHTDSLKGKHAGKSPGFGICLYAETTEGVVYCAEALSNPSGSDKGPSIPENIAEMATSALLDEVYNGGCVDSVNQSLACLFMALGPPDVSKLKSGTLTPNTVQFLRHLRDFASVMFKLDVEKRDEEDDLKIGGEKTILTCLGIGYTNLSKTIR